MTTPAAARRDARRPSAAARRDRDRPSGGVVAVVRRAFEEFLTLPTAMIAAFLLLACGMYVLDRARPAALEPARRLLQGLVFGSGQATSELLSTIASGLITVTSITVSLLLVALQQSASSLTSAVFDQFLRRRLNQFYFGFFVGLSLYALVTLATVNENFNPVLGATLAFMLTAVALCLLILLLYTSVNQMRPAEIVEEIHRLTLIARERQADLLAQTRRMPASGTPAGNVVDAHDHGYVTRIDERAFAAVARDGAEVDILPSIGTYVAFGDAIVRLRGRPLDAELADRLRCAIVLEAQRDLAQDAAWGIEQLEMIGWTSISSAKSNPEAGLLAIQALRDIMAHWCTLPGDGDAPTLPIVYPDDVFAKLVDAFEDFAIVASESMQHQTYCEVARTFAMMYERLPPDERWRIDDTVLRMLAALGDLVLTRNLELALLHLAEVMRRAGRTGIAEAIDSARLGLARSIGRLNARGTRVPGH
jgi:uncharacterized membrane protein